MKLRFFSAETDPGFQSGGDCDKGFDDMDFDFMKKLDATRGRAGIPFTITSGFRCPEYNNKVSSTGFEGPHTTGKAVDVYCAGSRERFLIVQAAIREGFTRIGIGEDFIHIDDTDNDPEVIWLY